MILGIVRGKMPRVALNLAGRSGSVAVELILDTGFDGQPVLPNRVIRDLTIRHDGEQTAFIPSAGMVAVPGYTTMVLWDGEWVEMEVLQIEARPLLGTDVLEDRLISIEMTDGGEVRIEEM